MDPNAALAHWRECARDHVTYSAEEWIEAGKVLATWIKSGGVPPADLTAYEKYILNFDGCNLPLD